MNRFCAFLRGVNVKGTSMKMAEVCGVFSQAGMKNVSSVLATGNIVFNSEKNSVELKVVLEKAMSEHFIYDAYLFIKTEKEVKEIFDKNPFETSTDHHIYAFVGIEEVEKTLLEEFQKAEKSEDEKGEIVRKTFYWQVKKGNTLDSNFGKTLGKKSLKDKMTSRNINTFEKILKKF